MLQESRDDCGKIVAIENSQITKSAHFTLSIDDQPVESNKSCCGTLFWAVNKREISIVASPQSATAVTGKPKALYVVQRSVMDESGSAAARLVEGRVRCGTC